MPRFNYILSSSTAILSLSDIRVKRQIDADMLGRFIINQTLAPAVVGVGESAR